MRRVVPGRTRLYGLMAEFSDPRALLAAVRHVRAAGYRDLDAYSPYPIHDLSEALELPRSKLPLLVFLGGLAGGIGGFLLQYWTSAIDYPLNVGGRPLNSWPAFIVPTFECTILAAAGTAVLGMFFLNRLPMPHHPVFNVERFALASRDRYFLVVKAGDEAFDREETRALLEEIDGVGAVEVVEY